MTEDRIGRFPTTEEKVMKLLENVLEGLSDIEEKLKVLEQERKSLKHTIEELYKQNAILVRKSHE
jgi:hypothetical protein